MPKDRGAEQRDVDGPLECSSALGLVAAETRGRVAWTSLQKRNACRLNTQPNCRESPTFSWGGPEQLTRTDDVMLCKRMEAWRTCGTWMMVTSCVTLFWSGTKPTENGCH